MGIPIRALIAVFACGCAAQRPAFQGSADEALAKTSRPRSTDCNTPIIDATPDVSYRKKMAGVVDVANAANLLDPLFGGFGAVGVVAILLGGSIAVGAEAVHERVETKKMKDEQDRCREHNQQTAEFQRSRINALTLDARQLTQLAAEAARSGDCERARRLEGAVDDQDPVVHDEVFVRDPAIRWCLTGKGAAPTEVGAPSLAPVLPPSLPPLTPLVAAKNPVAATLTRTAHSRAMRNDCAMAKMLEPRVLELDRAYHAQVFVVDPAIAACLR